MPYILERYDDTTKVSIKSNGLHLWNPPPISPESGGRDKLMRQLVPMIASSFFRHALIGLCALPWAWAAFAAGNCSNGKLMYNKPVSGLTCSNALCHGADPSLAPNRLISGANNSAAIADAIRRGAGGMNIFQGEFTATEIDDLAAWIAWGPGCETPAISVSPASIVFAPQAVGSTSTGLTYIIVSNTGPVPSGVSVSHSNAVEFPISNTCGGDKLPVGGVCAIRVSFQPSAPGVRSATVTLDNGVSPRLIGVYGSGTAAGSNTVDAVEYYYAEFDSYFVTAQPDEVVKLDNGVFAGWARTGLAFKVHPIGTSGSLTVCRFYSVAFGLKSAHFYTPVAGECARLKSNPDWIFEGEVFAIPGSGADGTCAAGRVPVYRLYNNGEGGAPNHRYTNVPAIRDAMIAAGWILEGNGPGFAFMCAPQ